jgi:hypothetical protein
MFPIHPAVRQSKPFFDVPGNVTPDVLPIALDMAEVSVRQVQMFRKQLEHAATRQVGALMHEVIEEPLKVFVPDLRTVHRQFEISLVTVLLT